MRQKAQIVLIACVTAIGLAGAACGDKSRNPLTPSAEPTLQSVEIVGKETYVVGETFQLQAIARFSDGTQQQVTAQAQWNHFNSGAIDVSGTGMLTALKEGKCGVVATYRGLSGQLRVVVVTGTLPPPPGGPGNPGEDDGTLVGLVVQGDPTVAVGQTTPWQAKALFNNGSERVVTAEAQWTSSSSGTASVNGGSVGGVAAGTATITAAYGGLQASGAILVTAAGQPTPTVTSLSVTGNTSIEVGQTTQLQAVAHFSDGTTLSVSGSASWSSANAAVAPVLAGLVSGQSAGSALITATYGGRSASATVQVSAATVTSLTVSGASTLQVGQSTQWQAVAQFSNGGSQNVTTTATWSSGTPAAASVSGGLVTGVGQGSSLIAAAFGGRSGSGTVTVTSGSTGGGTIVISGTPCSVVGQTAPLTATVNGQNVTTQVSWATGHPSIATVSSSGVLSCVGVGSTSVTATLAPHTPGSLPVSVSAASPDLIGLEMRVAGNVLTGSGPLGLDLSLASLLNGNPLLDLTVFGLYSNGTKQEVTSVATINCPTVPNPLVPCIVGLDGMGTVEIISLLLQGLLNPEHPVNVTYGGFTANLVVDLDLPVLQSVGLGNGSPVSLDVGNQLPAIQGIFSQGITSQIDADLPAPHLTHSIQLGGGVLAQLGGVPIIGPLLIGPLTTQINQVLGGLTVVDGVLTLSPALNGTLTSILENDLLEALGLNALPIDIRATVNGVTSAPLRVNLGN